MFAQIACREPGSGKSQHFLEAFVVERLTNKGHQNADDADIFTIEMAAFLMHEPEGAKGLMIIEIDGHGDHFGNDKVILSHPGIVPFRMMEYLI